MRRLHDILISASAIEREGSIKIVTYPPEVVQFANEGILMPVLGCCAHSLLNLEAFKTIHFDLCECLKCTSIFCRHMLIFSTPQSVSLLDLFEAF